MRSAPERRVETQAFSSDSIAAHATSLQKRTPWALIIPLIALGLVVISLAGWLVITKGQLGDTRTTLAAANSHITKLNGKVSSLASEVDAFKDEQAELQTRNSSLNSAMVDCKDAAKKARDVLVVVGAVFRGTASFYDYRTSANEADRAWSVCRTEANSNGAF